MPRTRNMILNHPRRPEIETDLLTGRPLAQIIKTYNICGGDVTNGRSLLQRYKRNNLPDAIRRIKEMGDARDTRELGSRLDRVLAEAMEGIEAAKDIKSAARDAVKGKPNLKQLRMAGRIIRTADESVTGHLDTALTALRVQGEVEGKLGNRALPAAGPTNILNVIALPRIDPAAPRRPEVVIEIGPDGKMLPAPAEEQSNDTTT